MTAGDDPIGIARAAMEALSRRELDRLLELSDPDVEWHSFFAELREGGAYIGYDGMRQYIEDLTEAFEAVDAKVEDGVAAGDVVLLVGHIHYRGKGSGFEETMPAGWVLKIREGRVLFFRAFREPGKALEAIGRPV